MSKSSAAAPVPGVTAAQRNLAVAQMINGQRAAAYNIKGGGKVLGAMRPGQQRKQPEREFLCADRSCNLQWMAKQAGLKS